MHVGIRYLCTRFSRMYFCLYLRFVRMCVRDIYLMYCFSDVLGWMCTCVMNSAEKGHDLCFVRHGLERYGGLCVEVRLCTLVRACISVKC